MKKIILIKEGVYSPNLFADFNEFVNNEYGQSLNDFQHGDDTVLNTTLTRFGFFHKTAFTFQLVGNVASHTDENVIAISHYANNPSNPIVEPTMFHPLDLNQLCECADQYGSLVYGLPLTKESTSSNALANTTMLVRDSVTKHIKDAVTNKPVHLNGAISVPIVSYFGFVKVKDMPVYYMIVDPRLLKIGEQSDIENDNFVVRLISDHDGAIKNNIVTPEFSSNVDVLSNNTLYVTGSEFTITLFNHKLNILKHVGVDTTAITINTRSNLPVEVLMDGTIRVCINNPHGYIKIKVLGGQFLDIVSPTESLTLEYSIVAIK